MTIVGKAKLIEAGQKHADAKSQLDAWAAEAGPAKWANPNDIKRRYASASFLRHNVVIFNIKGNRYRLVIKANYSAAIVLILWFGSHSEYDKMKF